MDKDKKNEINELREIEIKYRELVNNIYILNDKYNETDSIECEFKLNDIVKLIKEDKNLNPAKFAKIHLSSMMKIICLNFFCKNQEGIQCKCRAPVLLLGSNFRYVCYNFYPKVKKNDLNLSIEEYFKYTKSKSFKNEQQWINFLESCEENIINFLYKNENGLISKKIAA